ncbi:tudor and KH domain-containing protein [Phaenicophaeus curvirostris]|uniref:tudor and KH domain-containing protein n=1 Tax=Phaenicophaeus curvirostris TaxID=33595 RepID=UPI0037F0A12D
MASRGSWSSLTPLQKAAVLLGIPAGTAVLYILYRRYRETREEQLTLVGDKELELEVRVPRVAVKSLIGRKGATIKKLRWETGAHIKVEDEDEDEEATLLISGSLDQVCRAKAAIHQIVKESTPVSEQLCVPQRAVGRIIGRGGETVQGIQRSSGAKVFCERDAGLAPMRVIQLSGTQKEVAAAKKLIMEKLMEDNAFRKELGESTAARCLRKQPLGSRHEPLCRCQVAGARLPEPGEEEEGSSWDEGSHLSQAPFEEVEDLEDGSDEAEELAAGPEAVVPKFEVPSPDFSFQPDEHLEVYVSAAESPGRFWIQLIGQRSLQLDKLTVEMRQLYQSGTCGAELPVPQPGDIVAAPYLDGGDWHRARVLGEQPDGSLRLRFVDFGDVGEVPSAALRALRSDFLSLPFQAIECSLAGVAPAGAEWDEAALEAFARLTHCAAWQPLLARISSYAAAGIGTRPNVWLYDTLAGESLDVGAELVRLGHAVAQEEQQEDAVLAQDPPDTLDDDLTEPSSS